MKFKLNSITRWIKVAFLFFTSIYSGWVVLIYLLCWLLFYFFPFEIIPDYLYLERKIESGLFSSIIGNFSSILGIILTFFILTFGILRERLKRFALNELLRNTYFRVLITITLTVFICNILSLLIIRNDSPSNKDLTLAYFLILSSVLFLIGLIPLILKTINSINPKEIVINKITALKHEDYPKKEVIHFEHIDDNPILIIRNLLNSSFHENDVSLVNQILYSSTVKTCDLIIEKKTQPDTIDRLIDGLLVLWREYTGCSIRNKDYNNLIRIFECFEYLHVNFSKNDIYLRKLNEVGFFIRDLLTKSVAESIFEPIQKILFLIERIVQYHFDNTVPQEGEIPQLRHIFKESYFRRYPKMKDYVFAGMRDPFFEKNITWEIISHEIPYYLNTILYESIRLKRSDAMKVTFHAMESLENETIRSLSLGRFQKEVIIRQLQGSSHYYQIEAVRNRIITQPNEILNPNIDLVTEAIDRKYPFAITIIRKDFEFLNELINYNLFDLSYDPAVYFGAIGRHCMALINTDKYYRQCMFLILKEISDLKNTLETKGLNKENINEIYSQMASFKNYYAKGYALTETEHDVEISEEDFILMNKIDSFTLA